MVMSNAKDSEGQLLCCFQNSAMWYRRTISDVQLLQAPDFVVPDMNRVPGPLSKAQRHKQWLSGEQFYLKTMKALFKGMSNADASMPVCYIDLFPYDAWCENDQCFELHLEHFFLVNVLFISFSCPVEPGYVFGAGINVDKPAEWLTATAGSVIDLGKR